MPMPIYSKASLAATTLAAALIAGALVAPATLSGCARSIVTDGLSTNYDRTDPAAEVVFYHNLANMNKVSNDEALHALTLLADDEDPTLDYDARVEAAKARGWLNPNFNQPPDLVAQKGLVAECLVRMMQIEGGVWLTLLGPTPRYSVRELVNLGVMPEESSERQAMSGAEFVGILGRARDNAIIEKMRELRKTGE
jgi:hypothetical protein